MHLLEHYSSGKMFIQRQNKKPYVVVNYYNNRTSSLAEISFQLPVLPIRRLAEQI
jgi:hypothetical protein